MLLNLVRLDIVLDRDRGNEWVMEDELAERHGRFSYFVCAFDARLVTLRSRH